jgi:hypothetical protein
MHPLLAGTKHFYLLHYYCVLQDPKRYTLEILDVPGEYPSPVSAVSLSCCSFKQDSF